MRDTECHYGCAVPLCHPPKLTTYCLDWAALPKKARLSLAFQVPPWVHFPPSLFRTWMQRYKMGWGLASWIRKLEVAVWNHEWVNSWWENVLINERKRPRRVLSGPPDPAPPSLGCSKALGPVWDVPSGQQSCGWDSHICLTQPLPHLALLS